MKKNNINIVLVIIGVIVCLFAFLIIINNISEKGVEDWKKDFDNNKTIVTVIGLTTCEHCQEYKPIIKSLASKYKFNLYFIEIDSLTEEDKNTILTTVDLLDYTGYVPFTFIIKDKQYVVGEVGSKTKEETIEFLKNNEIIKEN